MEEKTKMLHRLRRIEGQVRGIQRMIEDDRNSIDVITQLQAIRAAISRVETEIVRQRVAECVRLAVGDQNEVRKRERAEELIRVLVRRPN